MNKVLITKYLSSVKNDDLPIFGAVVVNSNPSVDKDTVVHFTTTEPFNVSELGGAEVLNSDTRQPITSSVIGPQTVRITKDKSKTMHLIFNGIKYKPVLTDTIHCFGNCVLDLSILKYQSNLSGIIIQDGQSIGSLTDLPSGITTLSLGNSLITGNIKDLPSGITSLVLSYSSSIIGTLESYVEKLYNAHKNDGKDFILSAHTEETGVTFNGASASYLSITTISGGRATVRRGGEQGNIIGTYDGTSWTYNS